MTTHQVGVIIEQGLSNWQIIQQNTDGKGEFQFPGRWVNDKKGCVELRLVFEDTSVPVNRSLDCSPRRRAPTADGRRRCRIFPREDSIA